MENYTNKITFKANLKSLIQVKNSKRFGKIQQNFAEETSQFANEKYCLYLSDLKSKANKNDLLVLKTGDKKINIDDENKYYPGIYITRSFDEYLKKMSDKSIAIKLAKIFKVLHYEELFNKQLPEFKAELDNANAIAKSQIEKLSGEDKKDNKAVINGIRSRISALQEKYKDFDNQIRNNLRKASEGDAELEQRVNFIL